jgi:hypothetical protein
VNRFGWLTQPNDAIRRVPAGREMDMGELGNRMADAFGTEVISASDILSLAIATLPDIAAGDSFLIGGEVLTVRHAERDATGTAWRVFCQR